MSANLSTSEASSNRAGAQLGDYRLGEPQWQLRIADAYQATGPDGPVTLLVIHPAAAAVPAVTSAVAASVRSLQNAPEHKHLARVLGGGNAGGTLYVVLEATEGANVRDALARKRHNNLGGFGARGAGNLVSAAAGALTRAQIPHGAIAAESMVVTRNGGVRMIDLVLGAATVEAVRARVIVAGGYLAPEVVAGQPPNAAADVHGLGALLYEALVGQPLERGGPRPSEAVAGITPQVDELIGRACHRDPERRFGTAQVFGELCAEALGKGGVLSDEATPVPASAQGSTPSLAESLGSATAAPTVDRALAAALADSTEKWLISRGPLDYGPYSLAAIVEQIEKGEIVAGNVIVDKDTGGRMDVAENALLSPLIDAAKQARDDARRAQAEHVHHSTEKRRSAMLFGVIGLGVVALAVGVFFIIQAVRGDKEEKVSSVSGLGEAELKVTLSMPKKPAKRPSTGGGGGRRSSGGGGGGGAGLGGNADMSLDMSGDDDEGSETLGMDKVYATYSRYGGALGKCLQDQGGGQATIGIIVEGRSGKVTWLRVNEQASGPLFNCIGRVMKRMQFPTINGPRTRAEFDIAI